MGIRCGEGKGKTYYKMHGCVRRYFNGDITVRLSLLPTPDSLPTVHS
jgi:hypothetical protein